MNEASILTRAGKQGLLHVGEEGDVDLLPLGRGGRPSAPPAAADGIPLLLRHEADLVLRKAERARGRVPLVPSKDLFRLELGAAAAARVLFEMPPLQVLSGYEFPESACLLAIPCARFRKR